MKPRSASASRAETSWFTWSERVKWCRAWGEASRIAFTGPPQAGEDFTDRNQLAALTLHGFILPCSQDKTGTLPASIPETASPGPAPPAAW